ncbi:MAG: hypothetical protein COY81_04995 [Candidatus Pacebacteria bacterium CG_4_10_14_0_8_um_filter_43_12]|nr:MAG: hypothetical protein COU66_03425 [Candidatus Pacebacteria bacterium CG10_big_fil_rev_8_21_14_0_10_44_11]PIY78988.1 MAG: hypothetical protein COY81_04995 [Candidatus Pacebacteria bacterium CG_4_10_14_0_8_um_filter_43_12]
MRRREKFVLTAIFLSLLLLVVQYLSLDWRYYGVAGFAVITYFASVFVLWEDLQKHEWLTIVPFPAFYAGAVGLFYFLLPSNFLTRLSILAVFAIGMYAIFLTSNIYSVAKERTIQLLHAAHAIGLWMTLLTSLLFTNTIYSLRLPFYLTCGLIGLVHFPLIFMSLWDVRIEKVVSREVMALTLFLTLLITELALVLSFIPFSVWYYALFIMSFLYVGLSVLRSYLMGRLFVRALMEFLLVAVFIAILFLGFFPLK